MIVSNRPAKTRILRGASMARRRRGMLLGEVETLDYQDPFANDGNAGSFPVTSTESDPFSSLFSQNGGGGYNYSPSGSGYSSGAGSIFSAIGSLFSTKPAATSPYIPASSNTSTYLLIGAVVVGGVVLWAVLK